MGMGILIGLYFGGRSGPNGDGVAWDDGDWLLWDDGTYMEWGV